jgi:hypothetical protein
MFLSAECSQTLKILAPPGLCVSVLMFFSGIIKDFLGLLIPECYLYFLRWSRGATMGCLHCSSLNPCPGGIPHPVRRDQPVPETRAGSIVIAEET